MADRAGRRVITYCHQSKCGVEHELECVTCWARSRGPTTSEGLHIYAHRGFLGGVALCSFATGAAQNVDPARNAFVAAQDPLGEPVTNVVYLEQNWSPSQSVQFYFTSQGSQILPYGWFLALEQADSATLFRDNQNILKYRYLAQNPGPMKPDGLPVGFVAGSGTGRSWLGMTCAACHTAEIRLGTTAYRIDGGPTGGDVQAFLTDLTRALQQTQTDPAKFGRFAANILGSINSPANQAELKAQLGIVINARVGYNLRNFPGYDPANNAATAPTRYARLDAVGAIVNEVYLPRRQGRGPDLADRGHETRRCAGQLSVSLGYAPARRGAMAGHRQERRPARHPHPVAQRRRGAGRLCRFLHSRRALVAQSRLFVVGEVDRARGAGRSLEVALVAAVGPTTFPRSTRPRPPRERSSTRPTVFRATP